MEKKRLNCWRRAKNKEQYQMARFPSRAKVGVVDHDTGGFGPI